MNLRTLAREIASAVARGPATPTAPTAPIAPTTVAASTAVAADYRSPRHEQLEARRARCRAYWASSEAREALPGDLEPDAAGDVASWMVAGDVQDANDDRAELAANGGRFLGRSLEERLVDADLTGLDRARAVAAYNERQREQQTAAARAALAGREAPAPARASQAQAPDGGARVVLPDGGVEDWADRKAVQ